MRPTFLNFRSPKDLTPDFYCPKVTNDGGQLLERTFMPPGIKFSQHGMYPKSKSPLRIINEVESMMPCSATGGSSVFMSSVERFQSEASQSKVGFRVGPGSYMDQNSVQSLKKNSGAPKIMKLSITGNSQEQNKYMYVGS